MGGGLRASSKEDGITRLGTDLLGDASLLLLGNVFGNWTFWHALVRDRDVGQTLGSAGARPLLPGVELTAWQGGSAGHHHGTDVGSLKDPERSVGKEIGNLGDLVAKAQIRLVRAVAIHRLVPGDAR